MATYLESYALAADTDFRHRVAVAMLDYARTTVLPEAVGTPNHANRVTLMKQVFTDADAWAPRFALACVVQGAVPATTDAQLMTYCGNAWNALAGAL